MMQATSPVFTFGKSLGRTDPTCRPSAQHLISKTTASPADNATACPVPSPQPAIALWTIWAAASVRPASFSSKQITALEWANSHAKSVWLWVVNSGTEIAPPA